MRMTAVDFAHWVATMSAWEWTQKDCAAALGVHPVQISRWKVRGAPQYIAIACQAITAAIQRGEPLPGSPTPTGYFPGREVTAAQRRGE